MPFFCPSQLVRLTRCVVVLLLPQIACFALASHAAAETPIPVKVVKSADGWSLMRAGKPYSIQGAGGPNSLKTLAACGGNSVRVWGFDQLEQGRLDEAHQHGLTVAVGIWLRHDLDYNDAQQVAEQTRLVMEGVRLYKDHPSVLAWGIGNEMEGALGENPAVWQHVESLAQLIRKEDPLHPTMTVIAEIGGDKLKHLHRLCPSVDIVGVNSYGGAASLPRRYREGGGTKPYILTEYGPRGPWEFPQNAIKSFDEELGHIKAATYLESYRAAKADRLCLGSYAFMWGYKQEATPTWFGMFLQDGRKTQAVDVLTQQWSGKPATNLCPRIESLTLSAGNCVKANTTFKATLKALDPEGQDLKVDWVLLEDSKQHLTTGYFQETPPNYKDDILQVSATEATLRAPKKPGLYRIYAYVGDGQQAADAANVVFRVEAADTATRDATDSESGN